jgi:hypothetical protein
LQLSKSQYEEITQKNVRILDNLESSSKEISDLKNQKYELCNKISKMVKMELFDN